VHEEEGRKQGPHLDLRLRGRPCRGRTRPKDDARVADECSRECLGIEVERYITGEEVGRTLTTLFARRGEPTYVCLDSGPEFIEGRQVLAGGLGSKDPLHPAGLPMAECVLKDAQQSLGRRATKEGDTHQPATEAKALGGKYRNHYNRERPHSALGYRTPAEFAASCELASADEDLAKELKLATALS
jgi:putative transposase